MLQTDSDAPSILRVATPAEIQTVLDLLTPEATVAFIAEKAKAQDMPWLHAMAARDFFKLPSDITLPNSPSFDHNRYAQQSLSRVVALLAVTESSKLETKLDERPPHRQIPSGRPVEFSACPKFKDFLLTTTKDLVANVKAWKASPEAAASSLGRQRVASAVMVTGASLMHAACVIDSGELVQYILDENICSIEAHCSPKVLGPMASPLTQIRSLGTEAMPSGVSHWLTAMLYSSHHALDVLEADDGPALKLLVSQLKNDRCNDINDPVKRAFGQIFTTLVAADLLRDNALPCSISMLERVLLAQKENAQEKCDNENPFKAAQTFEYVESVAPVPRVFREVDHNALKLAAANLYSLPKREDFHQARIDVFMRTGVFDIDRSASVQLAVQTLDMRLLRHLASSLPLPSLADLVFSNIVTHPTNPLANHQLINLVMPRTPSPQDQPLLDEAGTPIFAPTPEAMVMHVLDMARDSGGDTQVQIFKLQPRSSQLLTWAIKHQCCQVLVRAMENGVDPQQPMGANPSPMEVAQQEGATGAEHIMRTFINAQKARAVMLEMAQTPFTTSALAR